VREIDLGLDFVRVGAACAGRLAGTLGFARGTEMGPDLLGFVLFNGTGVSLLLSDSNCHKRFEKRLALDFQLPGQIVDSNLAHPPFLTSGLSR
jgi:hypothetical protein